MRMPDHLKIFSEALYYLIFSLIFLYSTPPSFQMRHRTAVSLPFRPSLGLSPQNPPMGAGHMNPQLYPRSPIFRCLKKYAPSDENAFDRVIIERGQRIKMRVLPTRYGRQDCNRGS